jgi:hypothetical protein
MMIRSAVLGIAVLAIVPSCHQVMEYQNSDTTSLTFIRSDDFQVEHVMEGFSGGRTLVPLSSGNLLLIDSEGTLHRIDMNSFSVDTSYTIGGSSGTGYGDAALAGNGSLYVLGPGSQVIEVDLATSTVVDNFSPCPGPVAIASSPTLPRLYVADAAEDRIYEVHTGTNNNGFSTNLLSSPTDLFVDPITGNYVMIGCADGGISSIWLEFSTYARSVPGTYPPVSSMVPLMEDSVYVACSPRWEQSNGCIRLISGYVVQAQTGFMSLEGHPVDACFNHNAGSAGLLSVLARTDDGQTALSVLGFEFNYWDPHLETVIQLSGMPRDITSPGNGEYIVVLTSE